MEKVGDMVCVKMCLVFFVPGAVVFFEELRLLLCVHVGDFVFENS